MSKGLRVQQKMREVRDLDIYIIIKVRKGPKDQIQPQTLRPPTYGRKGAKNSGNCPCTEKLSPAGLSLVRPLPCSCFFLKQVVSPVLQSYFLTKIELLVKKEKRVSHLEGMCPSNSAFPQGVNY